MARAVTGVEMKDLKSLADEGKKRLGSGVVAIVGVAEDGKAGIVVGVTEDLTAKVDAVSARARRRREARRQGRRRTPRHGPGRRPGRRPGGGGARRRRSRAGGGLGTASSRTAEDNPGTAQNTQILNTHLHVMAGLVPAIPML